MVFNRALTASELIQVQTYLSRKFLISTMDVSGDGLTAAVDLTLGIDPLNPAVAGDGLWNGTLFDLGYNPSGTGLLNVALFGLGYSPATTLRPLLGPDPSHLTLDGITSPPNPFDPSLWQLSPTPPSDVTPPVIILAQPTGAVLLP